MSIALQIFMMIQMLFVQSPELSQAYESLPTNQQAEIVQYIGRFEVVDRLKGENSYAQIVPVSAGGEGCRVVYVSKDILSNPARIKSAMIHEKEHCKFYQARLLGGKLKGDASDYGSEYIIRISTLIASAEVDTETNLEAYSQWWDVWFLTKLFMNFNPAIRFPEE